MLRAADRVGYNRAMDQDLPQLLADLTAADPVTRIQAAERLGQLSGIAHAITGVMTNTRRDKMYDNIVFDSRATTEFTGRWGVVDLVKEFGLTQQAALEVSDHCPVWAEFSVYEGGVSPTVAGRPGSGAR